MKIEEPTYDLLVQGWTQKQIREALDALRSIAPLRYMLTVHQEESGAIPTSEEGAGNG